MRRQDTPEHSEPQNAAQREGIQREAEPGEDKDEKTKEYVRCSICQGDFYECKWKEVKELPCKHYVHLVYKCRIPTSWLKKKTLDEIKEHRRKDEEEERKNEKWWEEYRNVY